MFKDKQIRRHWDDARELWYFSIIDVIEAMTDSNRPRKYWSDLKAKLTQEGSGVSDKIGQLKMINPDGKKRFTDCGDIETMFRLPKMNLQAILQGSIL